MKMNMTHPCANCPFRSDIRPFLHRDRAAEIADSLLLFDESFPCHKTTEHDDDGEYVPGVEGEQHCAGAMILLWKLRRPNQGMRIAMRLRLFDPEKLAIGAPVFSDDQGFIAAQEAH